MCVLLTSPHKHNNHQKKGKKEERLTQMTKNQTKGQKQHIENEQSLVPKDMGNGSTQPSKYG
jgi:hypothetical protein